MTAVVLADGNDAIVRRLRLTDRPALEMLFATASDASLYTRFFSVGHQMVSRHLDHLFSRDASVRTYVLEFDGRLIAVADVETIDLTTAEIAFFVADDMQHRGVATLLLEEAAADARTDGVSWFVSDVLASNHPMLQVFADAGFQVERHWVGSEITLRMSTAADAATLAAHATRSASAGRRRAGRVAPLVGTFDLAGVDPVPSLETTDERMLEVAKHPTPRSTS